MRLKMKGSSKGKWLRVDDGGEGYQVSEMDKADCWWPQSRKYHVTHGAYLGTTQITTNTVFWSRSAFNRSLSRRRHRQMRLRRLLMSPHLWELSFRGWKWYSDMIQSSFNRWLHVGFCFEEDPILDVLYLDAQWPNTMIPRVLTSSIKKMTNCLYDTWSPTGGPKGQKRREMSFYYTTTRSLPLRPRFIDILVVVDVRIPFTPPIYAMRPETFNLVLYSFSKKDAASPTR